MAFLPDYDIALARQLVSGADLWLNTPQPPLEASGTSGMKPALNGVPSLSVLDGWWVEGCIEGVTGWAIGKEGDAPETHGRALYEKLEGTVLPLFHGDPTGWTRVMKGAISKVGAVFTSHRMMRRYAAEAYLSSQVRPWHARDHTSAGARRNPGPHGRERARAGCRRGCWARLRSRSMPSCHMVEAKQQKPRRIVIGPAFRDIANTRGMTATALRVFLTTSHPKMPNLILTPEEIADVSAYILSLRHRPPS